MAPVRSGCFRLRVSGCVPKSRAFLMNQTSVSLKFPKSDGSPWVHLPPNEPTETNWLTSQGLPAALAQFWEVPVSKAPELGRCASWAKGGAGLQSDVDFSYSFIFFYSWGDLVSFSSFVLSFHRLQSSTFFNSSRKVSIEHFLSSAESRAAV